MRDYFGNMTIERAMGTPRDESPLDLKSATKIISKISFSGEENKYEAMFDFLDGPQAIEFRYCFYLLLSSAQWLAKWLLLLLSKRNNRYAHHCADRVQRISLWMASRSTKGESESESGQS